MVQVACVTLGDQAWIWQLREEEDQEKHPVPLEKHTCQRCSKFHASINVYHKFQVKNNNTVAVFLY